jgi:hypothetical protein
MNERPARFLLIAVLILGLLLCACQLPSPKATPFPTLPPLSVSTPVALPGFLFQVCPEPGLTIEKAYFRGNGNYVSLNLAEIAEPGETLAPQDLQERTCFLLDNQALEIKVTDDAWGHDPIRAEVWVAPSPDPGEHQATIRVQRTSGELLEFSWHFTVVEEFVIPGLPEGFQFVRPFPNSTITLQDYQEGRLIPAEYTPGFANLKGGVCYGILGSKVVEQGEILTGLEVSEKARFVALDGVPPGPEAVIRGGSDLGLSETYDEMGQLITSYGGEQHYSCWRVDLAPGRHEVTVRLERASGQVTDFTWWFVITK